MTVPSITQERLKELLHYDPETGIFTRLYNVGHGKNSNIGDKVGTITHSDYLYIRIEKSRYFGHRLAWLYMTGKWPKEEIDHINGIRHDNRFINLREASKTMNIQNQRRPQITNKSTGVLGVHIKGKKFRAKISVNGKPIRLGLFNTVEEAHQAYLEAKRKYHEGCTI